MLLFNHSASDIFKVTKGDRVAQLVFVPVLTPRLVEVQKLGDSDRGNRGFGSTGVA